MSKNEAAALGAAIRDAAGEAGSLLVEATVQIGEHGSMPIVVPDLADAIKLIGATTPRVVYLVEQAFDLAGEIDTTREELADIGVNSSLDRLKAIRREFSPYDGQIGATIASFMVDSILHTLVSTAAWHDAFGEAIDVVLETARADANASRLSDHSESGTERKRRAVLLAAHPSFNYGRVSFDKRMTLAEALFPDCDQGELAEITRQAEQLFWLNQSGYKPDVA